MIRLFFDYYFCSGVFAIDEIILRSQGVKNFDAYKVDRNTKDDDILPDYFIPPNYTHKVTL